MPPNNTPDGGLTPREELASRTVFTSLENQHLEGLPPPPDNQTHAHQDNQAHTHRRGKSPTLPIIDWQGLEYVGPVDENLLCAICRTPFSTPVTTYQCRHTFCVRCLHQHLSNLDELDRPETCPLCRADLSGAAALPYYSRADRIVEAMVEQLQVKCPETFCDWTGPRGSVQHHVLQCGFSRVSCVDRTCDGTILRAQQREFCLHHPAVCIWCQDVIEAAHHYEHTSVACPRVPVRCNMCQAAMDRQQLTPHLQTCSANVVPCKFKELGCQHVNMGSMIGQHQETCMYGMIAELREHFTAKLEKPDLLETQMTRHIQTVEARMAAIEADQAELKDFLRRSNTSDMRGLSDGSTARSPDILETFDQLERRISTMSQGMVTREQRNSMMLLHEVMPLKEQMTEIRSQLGVLSMHVRWLMDVQRSRQRQNIFNAFSASSNSESESPSTGANDGATTPAATGRPLNGRTTPPRPSL